MSSRPGGFLAPGFTAMAHRGGALLTENLGIENTSAAFKNAVRLGFEYLETDVHVTRDGALVAFHDAKLDRVTGTSATIAQLTFEELRQIRVGGKESIPTMDELFDEFRQCCFNVDLKAPGAVEPLVTAIRAHGAQSRVCVGSFSGATLRRFRRLLPEVTTSVSPIGAAALAFNVASGDRGAPRVYQVPISHRVAGVPVRIVTPSSVRAVHRSGRKIHVWTIDDPLVMHELIDWGVDGIVTDRPDLLKRVLRDRGMWSTRFGG